MRVDRTIVAALAGVIALLVLPLVFGLWGASLERDLAGRLKPNDPGEVANLSQGLLVIGLILAGIVALVALSSTRILRTQDATGEMRNRTKVGLLCAGALAAIVLVIIGAAAGHSGEVWNLNGLDPVSPNQAGETARQRTWPLTLIGAVTGLVGGIFILVVICGAVGIGTLGPFDRRMRRARQKPGQHWGRIGESGGASDSAGTDAD